jgi:N-acetylglutamate synthase-like GNAT family acetyltransferase
MKIRQANTSDIETLAGIIKDSFQTIADRFGLNRANCPKHPSNCTNEWINTDMKRGVTYFVLAAGGKETGCAALEKADHELCYLERLAVLPESRNQGFGKALVFHILCEAKKSGHKTISIGIIAKQHELKNWYSTMGFKEGITKCFDHLPFDVTFMEYEVT